MALFAESSCSSEQMRMLPEKPYSPSTELISGDGIFNEAGLKNFLKFVKFHEHDSVVVVAIVGQQSSGKSTLMNHLFLTNFKEMKPRQPRGATTKGIWTAKALETERLIIAVDLEGTDSREKEDDKTFERQSGTFAAIIADVIIINMNCQNIGLEEGGNRPLLKVIFEAMMRLFPRLFRPRKTTLFFVLRNKTEVEISDQMLESDLRKDVEKIWETALKPTGHENTPLSQFFNVEVVALSSYKSAPVKFAEEVDKLRSRLLDETCPRIVVPGSEVISFAGAKTTWDTIKGCKELDLPPYKVMVATVRCEEIAMEKMRLFESDTDWLALKEAAASRLVVGFSTRTSSILLKYLSQYDSECERYENDVSREKRKYLMSEASKVIRPAHMSTLSHGRSDALRSFETLLREALSEGRGFAESVRTCQESCEFKFDEQCGSDDATFSNDVSTVRRELLRDIENHWHLVRADKLPQIAEQHRERLSAKLSRELRHLLSNIGDTDIWGCIRSVVRDESDAAALALPLAVAEFELDQEIINEMVDGLRQKARELMEKKFKEIKTHHVLTLLKNRFMTALIPVGDEVNQPTIEDAYRECVKLLSTVAVIRLDEREGGEDNVESVLLSALMPAEDQILPDPHPLASDTWKQVSPMITLITPVTCKDIWNQFKTEMEQNYADALRLQGQSVKDKHWRPLTWVILGLLTLGGCAAFIVFIRVTNIDVLGYAATGICMAAKGIGTTATASIGIALAGISLALKGMDALEVAIELWKIVSQEAPNFTEFCRRNRTILKTLKQALKKLYKRIKSFAKREADVAA